MFSGCKSWVWKATTHECCLKKEYDPAKNTVGCDDCVAYKEQGEYFVHKVRRKRGPKDRSWEYRDDPGVYMPKDIAEEICTSALGYDQPAEFDIFPIPLIVKYSFLCCNACAERNGSRFTFLPPKNAFGVLKIVRRGSTAETHMSAL